MSGFRVVDRGWVWAGAIPGQLLADMGAEVIKVESRRRLDYMRQGKPLIGTNPDPEQNPWFHALNRNKKSITVNLGSPRGVELLREVVRRSDVLLENFTPGFMHRIGFDYAALAEIHPRLVMLSLSGVGQSGPLREMPAYAPLMAGMSGLDSLVGYPGERVLGIQQPYADSNAGVWAAFAVLAALFHREQTGEGQHVDVSELEAGVSVIGEAIVEYGLTGVVPAPCGNDRRGYAPHGHYPCAGVDVWIAISVASDAEWAGCCRALETVELGAAPRFATAEGRWEHRRELDREIARHTRKFEAMPLMHRLQAEHVAAAPIMGPAALAEDPHLRARGAFAEVHHPVLGRELVYGPAWTLSGTPGGVDRHAPLLGEHNAEIFGSLLGLTADEVAALEREGVLS
ncbi:MAG: CoA transferase [Candidatus Rokubacteria bacterium]|nr:CoA transferase [Candidatus Rokubacteria bacterium]